MAELKDSYDLVIIGGGPTGLAAGIYAGREGIDTVILDKSNFGGMAVITDLIENYPGFSEGVTGQQLIAEMTAQSERFGAQSAPFSEATEVQADTTGVGVTVGQQTVSAKAALIATGSVYRKLDIPGESELIGRGVHYCATCDGPLYKGKHLVVVGGGNSALQETLFLARFASSIEVLVRGKEFSGSEVLVKQLYAEPNVTVRFQTVLTELERPEPKGPLRLHVSGADGEARIEAADGLFVFVGLLPNSEHFSRIHRDDRNFVLGDANFQTDLPGIFVAGDVRSGSTWQIASAVGEGVTAALKIRTFLDERYPDWHRRSV